MFEGAINTTINGGTFHHIQVIDDSNSQAQKTYLKLCRWLSLYNWTHEYSSTRMEGSCEWSTRHPMVQDWLCSDTLERSHLWIHGGPGTGKSVLAAYMMDRMKTHRLPEEVVFTVFCKIRGDIRPSSASILLGFIRQYLVDYYPNVHPGIVNNIGYTIFSEKKGYPFNAKQVIPHLWSILELPEFKKACFIIDGIDECEREVLEPGGVIDMLSNLQIPTKLLLLGRREAGISKYFDPLPQVEIGTDATTQEDIRGFIDTTVKRLVLKFDAFKDHESRLKDGLLKMAGNMFLLVKLKAEAITDLRPSSPAKVKQVMDTLNDISPGLEKVYEELLREKWRKWDDGSIQIAVRTLLWLMTSRAPVTRTLLRVVAAIDIATGVLSVDDLDSNIVDTVEDILGVLVDWQREKDSGMVHIALVHHSFREYLISKEIPFISSHQPLHGHLFETCCVVLRSPSVAEPFETYFLSADERRQRGDINRTQCWEQGWDRWEQRQKGDLSSEHNWRSNEAIRIQKELDDLGDDVPPAFVERQKKKYRLLCDSERKKSELAALRDVLHLPERELMIYALQFLPYHLAQVLRQANKTPSLRIETASAQITAVLAALLKVIDLYRPKILEQADASKFPSSGSSNASASSIVDLSIALESLGETRHIIEHLVQLLGGAIIDTDQSRSYFRRLKARIDRSHLMNALERISFHFHSTASPSDVWKQPAIVQAFENSNLSPAQMHNFFLVTQAISNLRNIEYALRNFDEHNMVLMGSSILVHTLRRTAHMLSLWLIIYGHNVCSNPEILTEVLMQDNFLYPNMFWPPKIPRRHKVPSESGVLLFDYDLWNHYPLILPVACFIWFLAGIFNPLPVLVNVSLLLLRPQHRRYSFQSDSPTTFQRTIHIFVLSHLAGLISIRFLDVVVVAVGFHSEIAHIICFEFSNSQTSVCLGGRIIDARLSNIARRSSPIVDRYLSNYTIYFALGGILSAFTNFRLGIATVYFIVVNRIFLYIFL